MKVLLKNGYKAKMRPSGHDISEKFSKDNRAAIPPNLLALANTESNSHYLRYCEKHCIKPHPARFPAGVPEYSVRMLTDTGDFVIEPFAGSCVTGEVCDKLRRKWICIDVVEEYLRGAKVRFQKTGKEACDRNKNNGLDHYKIFKPGVLSEMSEEKPLQEDGGRKRARAIKAR